MMSRFYSADSIFIVAELSGNHNNDLDLALRTVKAIADSGADAIKVQTYRPESLTLDLREDLFAPRTTGIWKGLVPWEVFSQAALPYEWHAKLKDAAETHGLVFFSTPFDLEGVDFLEELGVPMYKIASLEINDHPLLNYVASQKKPMLISTGAATKLEIDTAVATCRAAGCDDITLLKCTSQYPAKIEDANLRTIQDMRSVFKTKVGLSDHTMGGLVPVLSVAYGVTVIEKHFILDRGLGGPDAPFSMEPQEFREMVNSVRQAQLALGKVTYDLTEEDRLRRRSLFFVTDLEEGAVVGSSDIRSIRPGHGLSPENFDSLLGRTLAVAVKAGTPTSWEHFV